MKRPCEKEEEFSLYYNSWIQFKRLGLGDEETRRSLEDIRVKPWNNLNHVLYPSYKYRAAYGNHDLICQKIETELGKAMYWRKCLDYWFHRIFNNMYFAIRNTGFVGVVVQLGVFSKNGNTRLAVMSNGLDGYLEPISQTFFETIISFT